MNYLGVTCVCPEQNVLPSVLQGPAGKMLTKRKKSGVESAVAGKKSGKCTFCFGIGHEKRNRPVAKSFGRRLTKTTWGLLTTVRQAEDVPDYWRVDPVVPKDAMCLQVV